MEKLNIQEETKDESPNSPSKAQEQLLEKEDLDRLPKRFKHATSHPIDQIIGHPSQGIMTRASRHQYYNNVAFISKVEPTCVDQALEDEF